MQIIVLSAILLLIVGADRDAHASTAGMFDDDVIRVLFVIDHSTQLSKADQMISHLNQTWQRYNWEPGTISLEVVNLNSPIMKPSPRFSGNKDQLVDQLKACVEPDRGLFLYQR